MINFQYVSNENLQQKTTTNKKKTRKRRKTSLRDLNLIVVVTGIFKITSILIHKLNLYKFLYIFSIVIGEYMQMCKTIV